MDNHRSAIASLAAAITKAASKQTYYTIRLLVDRGLVNEAFLAYGYFRWVDDKLDSQIFSKSEKTRFISRQKYILESCYRDSVPSDICIEEKMLVELVKSDRGDHPGLRSYLKNMMAILVFDANRHGALISKDELSLYTQGLATAVTDAMHYFIGHDDPIPADDECYSAVKAAHITHMLRDTSDDITLGYFNIPSEYLAQHKISPHDIEDPAFQSWACRRVKQAREDFKKGRQSLAKISSFRCRLVGFAYTARFEWMLKTIEKENYCLRSQYDERKGLSASLWMGWNTIISTFASPWTRKKPHATFARSSPMKES